jgi:hypothetical protein
MIQQGQVFKLKAKGAGRSAVVGVPVSVRRAGIGEAASRRIREPLGSTEGATESA